MAIFIGAIPNTQEDDVVLAKKILTGELDISKEREVLESILKKIFCNCEIFLLNRGRDALYLALKALDISKGDEVLIQGFTCIAVLSPILWVGATPKYVDIDPKTFNMDFDKLLQSITESTRAIIIQHTFGNIFDISKLQAHINEINSKRKEKERIHIIEDCAHLSFGALDKVFKYSNIALFSFAQDKSISSTQGGLVVFKDSSTAKRAAIMYDGLSEQSSKEALYNVSYIVKWFEIKQEYFKSIFSFYKRLTIGRIKIIIYRYLGIIKQQANNQVGSPKDIRRYSNEQSSLLLNQIPKLEKFENHRKKITALYDNTLSKELLFCNHSNILMRYPVLVSNPSEVLSALSKEKYICGRWYGSVVFPLTEKFERVGYIMGSCTKAELCSKYIINLPTNIDTAEQSAKDIVRIVNKVGKAIKI